MDSLKLVQTKLEVPKNQYNSFGRYNYRSCEDILKSVKPLLKETNSTILLTDEIVQIGQRYYIKATATFKNGEGEVSVSAFAREPESKKGMDESQITGTASSYARKYALNGLLCIDDAKDSDTGLHQDTNHKKKPEVKSNGDKISDAQRRMIEALIEATGIPVEQLKREKGIQSITDMTKAQADMVVKELKRVAQTKGEK